MDDNGENKKTYIILYRTPEEGIWDDNIYTTDNEKDFNNYLDYLKKERVGNDNFYSCVCDIRTIISPNNTGDQLLRKLIKEEKY